MRKCSIILALVLCIALLAAVPVMAANVEIEPEIAESPAPGEGDVTLTVSTDGSVCSGEIEITYDKSALSFVSAKTTGGAFSAYDDAENSVVRLEFSSVTPLTGEFASFQFQGTGSGSTTVAVETRLFDESGAADEQSHSVNVRYSSGGSVPVIPDPGPGSGGGATQQPSQPEPQEPAGLGFVDLVSGAWYYDAVETVVKAGYMTGESDTIFDPDGTTTRAMFVTILGRVAGVDGTQYTGSTFTDVEAGSWYAPYVAWAEENGITAGTSETTFSPEGIVTRQEMVTFLHRFAEMQGKDVGAGKAESLGAFADADQVGSWAEEALLWATGNGIIQGTGSGLAPKAGSTRAQVAQVIVRYISL